MTHGADRSDDEENGDGGHVEGTGTEADPSPAEVFDLLANETRIHILEALWDAEKPELSFSELRRAAGVRDSGQFNYHLGHLTDHFVTRTEAGYRLRESGMHVVQSIRSGSFTESPSFGPVELDARCQHCDEPLEVSYDDELLVVGCTGREGHIPGDPPGALLTVTFPPAGLRDRTPAEVAEAALALTGVEAGALAQGICRVCSGRLEATPLVCEAHEGGDGRICPACDAVYAVFVEYVCTNCRDRSRTAAWYRALQHPAVVAFFDAHGVTATRLGWDLFGFNGYHETVRSVDPLLLDVAIRFDGEDEDEDDELVVTIDDSLDVVAVS